MYKDVNGKYSLPKFYGNIEDIHIANVVIKGIFLGKKIVGEDTIYLYDISGYTLDELVDTTMFKLIPKLVTCYQSSTKSKSKRIIEKIVL